MFLSEIIQRFIHGVEPAIYIKTFLMSGALLFFVVPFHRMTSVRYDRREPNNLWGYWLSLLSGLVMFWS